MNEILIAQGITILFVVIGFIGNILYFKGSFTERIKNVETGVDKLQKSIVYTDTCEAIVRGVEGRLTRLEVAQNGER